MGLFSRKNSSDRDHPHPEGAEPTAGPRSSAGERLPEDGALRRLVDHLLTDEADSAKLTLIQRGSTMNYQIDRSVSGAPSPSDTGVVDQASPLFDDVAQLYTEAMDSPTGAWQTAVISVGAPDGAAREVAVDYDFPSAPHRTDRFALDAPETLDAPGALGASATSAADGDAVAREAVGGSSSLGAHPDEAQGVVQTGGDPVTEEVSASDRLSSPGPESSAQEPALGDESPAPEDTRPDAGAGLSGTDLSGAAAAGAAATGAAGAAAGTAEDDPRVPEGQLTEDGEVDNLAPRQQGQEPIEVDPQVQQAVAQTTGHRQTAGGGTGQQSAQAQGTSADHDLSADASTQAGPVGADRWEQSHDADIEQDHAGQDQAGADLTEAQGSPQDHAGQDQDLTGGQASSQDDAVAEQHGLSGRDDAERGEVPSYVDHDEWRQESRGSVAPAAATGAAAARSFASADESSAPTVASAPDVAPSAREAELDADAGRRLAPGNRVLTASEVAQRTAGAHRHLFGPQGTARDVSVVLVRVRILGTYWDALTHVREGGFWDQRPTFDLMPEDELQVPSLKQDSYVEGEGSPLAIMFRFRPGLPPEVSFDYDDEEAFVRYESRLPSQNYVEELRMYPRTGANIPQHVNDALQDWNY